MKNCWTPMIVWLAASSVGLVHAVELLPDRVRTERYSGFTTGIRGDVRTVGMAGATVALGDTFIASMDNPAGLAMTVKTGDTHVTANQIRDRYVQDPAYPIDVNSFGAAINTYPWGFSLGGMTSFREGRPYALITDPNTPRNYQVSVHDLRAGVARVLLDDRLSVGGSFNLGIAEEAYGEMGTTSENDYSQKSHRAGYTLGALYQLPRRMLIGVSYTSPFHYSFEPDSRAQPQGVFQPVDVPWRLGAGVGWIPNRFFRAGFTVTGIGDSPGAALLRDQNRTVGKCLTLQPKLGAAYVFADYRNIRGTLFGGTYLEVTRIDGFPNRVHVTSGLEAKFWFVNIGLAIDGSEHYRNSIASIGIDPFGLLAQFEIIPRDPPALRGGFLPPVFTYSDDGLPRPLVEDWAPAGPVIDPLKVGMEIPEKIGAKLAPGSEGGFGKGMLKSLREVPKELIQEISDEIKEIKEVEEQKRQRQEEEDTIREVEENLAGKDRQKLRQRRDRGMRYRVSD